VLSVNIEGGDGVREKIEAIVRQVVTDYLKTHQVNKKLLILLNYETTKREEVWENVRQIASSYPVSLCVSKDWNDVPHEIQVEETIQLEDISNGHIEKLVEQHDALIIPVISYGFLAKMAMTIDDEKTLSLSIQMQLAGKKLLLADDAIARKGMQKLYVPHKVQERIDRYKSQLTKEGIYVGHCEQLRNWLDKNIEKISRKRPIVLAKHIEEIADEGEQQLVLTKEAVISPLGKDMARELGISLKVRE
jgi:hypothetical protein